MISLKVKKLIRYALLLVGMFLPAFVFAAPNNSSYLFNPLPVAQELYCYTAYCDLKTMFLAVIQAILTLVPVASVLFIIVGAFQMISSHGNEERLAAAKRTVVWAVLGLVIAMLSFSIIAIVQNFLQANLQ